jgi:arsenate reductase
VTSPIGLHGLLRQKAPPYAALGITPSSSDEAILDALQAHAILLDRPIVVTDKGTRLCRPAERVREIL